MLRGTRACTGGATRGSGNSRHQRGRQHVPYYELIVRTDPGIDLETIESETGLRCTFLDGRTRLDGELVDQAALHGTIERIFRLGLELQALELRSGRHGT
jgi:hypothetical protein